MFTMMKMISMKQTLSLSVMKDDKSQCFCCCHGFVEDVVIHISIKLSRNNICRDQPSVHKSNFCFPSCQYSMPLYWKGIMIGMHGVIPNLHWQTASESVLTFRCTSCVNPELKSATPKVKVVGVPRDSGDIKRIDNGLDVLVRFCRTLPVVAQNTSLLRPCSTAAWTHEYPVNSQARKVLVFIQQRLERF
jgi:hypothetical protein